MAGEDKDRHQMMQNLFSDQSEEEEEEEEVEVESEHESYPQPDYASDEGLEAEGEGEVQGPGNAAVVSEGEFHDPDVESEAEQDQSSQEVEAAEHREESDGKESETDEKEGYGERVATSRRRDVIESGSERSEENHYADNEDEEVGQTRSLSRSPEEEKDEALISNSAPEIRDVFGDSDDEEQVEYTVHDNAEADFNRSNLEEEEDYDRELRPEDMVADEEGRYDSDEGNVEPKIKERPVGPSLELEMPLRPPPATPDKVCYPLKRSMLEDQWNHSSYGAHVFSEYFDKYSFPFKMNMIRVSNIMGIDSKPFDPKKYEDEDIFVTDESGSMKKIRLGNNIVRWRIVRKPDGTVSVLSSIISMPSLSLTSPSSPSKSTETHQQTPNKEKFAPQTPPSSVIRLWRPSAQRNVRNQWSKLASYRKDWSSSSSSARSHATDLANSSLSQRYMKTMELGVLSDMLNIRKKACWKLFKQQELCRNKLLSSYKNMLSAVVNMVNSSRSMRTFRKGTNNLLVQFSSVSEDKNDHGDGGGIPVFTFLSISFFEELACELIQMFKMELHVKRQLVVELLSLSSEEFPIDRTSWSNELYPGEFNDLSICELYSEDDCEPIHPKTDTGSNHSSEAAQCHLEEKVLRVYLTTWLAEVNIDTFRVDEIFAMVGEEMHVGFS